MSITRFSGGECSFIGFVVEKDIVIWRYFKLFEEGVANLRKGDIRHEGNYDIVMLANKYITLLGNGRLMTEGTIHWEIFRRRADIILDWRE